MARLAPLLIQTLKGNDQFGAIGWKKETRAFRGFKTCCVDMHYDEEACMSLNCSLWSIWAIVMTFDTLRWRALPVTKLQPVKNLNVFDVLICIVMKRPACHKTTASEAFERFLRVDMEGL